jgi:hypothetical protein
MPSWRGQGKPYFYLYLYQDMTIAVMLSTRKAGKGITYVDTDILTKIGQRFRLI